MHDPALKLLLAFIVILSLQFLAYLGVRLALKTHYKPKMDSPKVTDLNALKVSRTIAELSVKVVKAGKRVNVQVQKDNKGCTIWFGSDYMSLSFKNEDTGLTEVHSRINNKTEDFTFTDVVMQDTIKRSILTFNNRTVVNHDS